MLYQNSTQNPLHKDLIKASDILFGEGTKYERDLAYKDFMEKLKTKYPDLTLSRVHLGRVVRDINFTLKQT